MTEIQGKILVVDDDKEILTLVGDFIQKHGYKTVLAMNASEMDKLLSNQKIDLMVLDLMLPGEDGLSITRRLRAEGNNIPIIMLTAMGEDIDRIIGLEMGADDYLPKPFNPRELLARIKTVLRRSDVLKNSENKEIKSNIYIFEDFKLNLDQRKLIDKDEKEIVLSSGEFDLLKVFLENPKRVLSRDYLMDYAKGRDVMPFDRSIDIQVSRLRKKIENNPKEPQLIITVRGSGYMLTRNVKRLEQ